MQYQSTERGIIGVDETGKICCEATLRTEGSLVEIQRIYVHDSLRGQGIAGQLMQQVIQLLKDQSARCVARCSYADQWFEKHPEYHHLLATQEGEGAKA